jgi:hypothetical protein
MQNQQEKNYYINFFCENLCFAITISVGKRRKVKNFIDNNVPKRKN